MDLTQILFGSLLLSAIHAAIPNHWLPLVAVAKAQRWVRSETLVITAVAGFAHVSSTVLIGVLVGLLGYKLSTAHASIASIVAPIVLIGLGVIYLILGLRSRGHRHAHIPEEDRDRKVSRLSLVASLCVAMFFSPCLEIEAYYFAAGSLGWSGIALVSLVYVVATVLGMVLLVDLGLRGASKIRSRFLEEHEKRVTGLILIALGAIASFVEL
jgi:putative Mn2+ efflux pump MntP